MEYDKLIRRVSKPSEMDSVKARKAELSKTRHKDLELLQRCETLWHNLESMRESRARVIRFAWGDQWGDLMEVDGEVMTQRQYLQRCGNIVLQSNQIKSKIETIAGLIAKEQNEPVASAIDKAEQQYAEMVTEGLKANCKINKMDDLYNKWSKDLCAGGLAIGYEVYDDKSGPSNRMDSWTKYQDPNTFIMDSEMSDPRFWDVSLLGKFDDYAPQELAAKFGRSEKDWSILRDIYPNQFSLNPSQRLVMLIEKRDHDNVTFREGYDPTACRVYEIWTRETKARIRLHDTNAGTEEIIDADDYQSRKNVRQINEKRKRMALSQGISEEDIPYITGDGYGRDDTEKNGFFIDVYWYCRFLAPDGTILWEGESPYADRQHPFTICATPFVDGKIVGYSTDAVDHNIAMNRALVLHDWLLRVQAKGVVVVPKDLVPNDMTQQDFARAWTRVDDMVFVDVKPGYENLMPKVFHGAAHTFDVAGLINTYKGLMDDSTSISGAIQGKTPYSGTSGSLYAQMASNASTAIAGLLNQFHSFLESLHIKKMKNIIKFYDAERWHKIVGGLDDIAGNANMNLNRVEDVELDLVVTESAKSPSYRAQTREDLKNFVMNGLITMDEYLAFSDEPFAEKMLQARQARAAEMQGAQAPMMQASPTTETGV